MGTWTDDQIEAFLTLETRMIEMPDGSMRPMTYTHVVWAALDELVLEGGYTIELLVTYAEKPGWPPNTPFEIRLSSVIADTQHRWRAWRREQGY